MTQQENAGEKSMIREEAEREVQRLLSEAQLLMDRAENLMNVHRFSASFLGKSYCPNALTEDELEDGEFPINHDWMGVGDGGEWMGSSDQC